MTTHKEKRLKAILLNTPICADCDIINRDYYKSNKHELALAHVFTRSIPGIDIAEILCYLCWYKRSKKLSGATNQRT